MDQTFPVVPYVCQISESILIPNGLVMTIGLKNMARCINGILRARCILNTIVDIQGYQGSLPEAQPTPHYSELYPAVDGWRKFGPRESDWPMTRKQDRYRFHLFFPEGERQTYFKDKQ